MRLDRRRYSLTASLLFSLIATPLAAADLPDARPALRAIDLQQILREVQDHQRQVEAMRENYTYDCLQTTEDIDGNGQVRKTHSEEREEFFVNGHMIGRMVEKDGQPLTASEQQKESERIEELVAKAENTPPEQRLEGPNITVSRVLELMELRNPRRETFRGRPTIVFDFAGRRDAKTHGLVEDASKKLEGTVWIDAEDLQVAHLEVRVDDDFRIGGGLLAKVEKGSNFRFDQAPVEGGLWLPIGSEAEMQARVLLIKNVRERRVQRDFGFKRFAVETSEATRP